MFDNIGGKIKGLAVVSTVIGFAASVITGIIITFSYGDFESFMLGVGVMFAGFLFSWISSLTLYGLGQLIENTDELVAQGREIQRPSRFSGQNTGSAAPAATYTATPATAPANSHPVFGIPVGAGRVRCPSCRLIVKEDVEICTGCGQVLIAKKN